MTYKLGIFATVRSGTTYIRKILKDCHVAVGHMNLGPEGVVLYDFPKTLNQARFDHAWHQTRDPLKTIASIAASAQMFWREQTRHLPGIDPHVDPVGPLPPRYVNAMLYWLWWTERCERATTWRYKVEDVSAGSQAWCAIVARLDLGDVIFPNVPTDTNTKPHPPATWDALAAADPLTAAQIKAKSDRYGY